MKVVIWNQYWGEKLEFQPNLKNRPFNFLKLFPTARLGVARHGSPFHFIKAQGVHLNYVGDTSQANPGESRYFTKRKCGRSRRVLISLSLRTSIWTAIIELET